MELYPFIVNFYEGRTFVDGKDGVEVTKLVIKSNQSVKDLENLAKAFEAIGYFNVGDVLKGTAVDAASKAKDKIAGFFS